MLNGMETPLLTHHLVTSTESVDRWLYVLHGIYGSGRNWATLARGFTEDRPRWGVVLVDLRLHGGSIGFPPPHTVRACADDLARLEEVTGRPATAVLGHSFGGKVAIVRASDEPEALRQVWAVDSPLDTKEPSGSAWEVLQTVRQLPDRFESRNELVEAMEQRGFGRGLGQWLAMNLDRTESGLTWRIDWDGVEEMLRNYHATEVWPIVDNPPADIEIHVVRATRSKAVNPDTVARLQQAGERTGRVHLHEVEGSHWINVDNPEGVRALLEQRIAG